MNLKNKILSKKAEIGVVGLGYVGLSLSMELVKSGLRVHGIDIDVEKVEQLNRGESPVQDVAGPILKAAVDSGHFRAYQDYEVVSRVDCVIICVPTPLRQTKDPDISYIMDATREIRRYLHNDMLIILESTTYPGTTEEVLSTELQSDRFKVGKDLFLAFSPERADPGILSSIPKTLRRSWVGSRLNVPRWPRSCTSRSLIRSYLFHRQPLPKWSSCWRTLFER